VDESTDTSTETGSAVAREVAALVRDVCGVLPRVAVGLSSEVEHDGQLRVPPTWRARVRSVRDVAARPVVAIDGDARALVVLDARVWTESTLRPGERCWRVVAVRATDAGDGLETVAGVLRWARGRDGATWRLARSLADARRRASAATLPDAWSVRVILDAEPSAENSAEWRVRGL